MSRFVSILILVLLLLALAAIAPAGLLPGDDATTRAIAGSGIDLSIVSRIASLPVWSALVLVTVAVMWLAGIRRGAVLLLVGDLSAELVSLVLKEGIGRPRPAFGLVEDAGATASFPSNSVVRVAVTLGVLVFVAAWHRPRWRAPAATTAVALALLVGFSRIASGEHWLSDVIAAYLLAGAWLLVIPGIVKLVGADGASTRRRQPGAT
ncbi:MAG TPA: phosphatase PAP2 family protein [Chloroflexota bacterium]|nr:phosphatase PAP2 family protein [Chloroflexota bacterium]